MIIEIKIKPDINQIIALKNHLSEFHTLQFNSKGARVDCLEGGDFGASMAIGAGLTVDWFSRIWFKIRQ